MLEKKLHPFDPEKEFAAGRYTFDEKLGLGKFDKCYTIPVLAADGEQFLLGTFQDDHIDFISQACLPDDVFIPTVSQMEKWIKAYIGANWRDEPQKVLDAYGVKLYGDVYHSDIMNVNNAVFLASSSRRLLDGSRKFLAVYRLRTYFEWYDHHQCAFVPVFFSRDFYNNHQEE